MPELPEVEVVRRGLAAEVAGARIESVTITGRRSVRRQDPADLSRRATGARLGRAVRIGKYLVVPFAADRTEERQVLVVHLRMSGQLRLTPADAPLLPHTHVVFRFGDGRELRFVDPRTFGEVFIDTIVNGGAPAALAHLGPDPLDVRWTASDLAALCAGRRAQLKPLLMDQRRLAGLGNIYSDEALFAAGLRFDRGAGSLDAGEVERLHTAIGTTLRAAVAHRGSSLADAQYVDLFGAPGSYQALHQVYGREGQPCPRCSQAIVRLRSGGRSTFLCGRCQS